MLEKMEEVFEAWWQAWYSERLADYVAKPPKWFRSDPDPREGDIVVFQKRGPEQVLGSPVWSVGRVVSITESGGDGKVREIELEYKNVSENTWRRTRRSVCTVGVLHREEDLDTVQALNQAAREAEKEVLSGQLYFDQQLAVCREVDRCELCVAPFLCMRHSAYFAARPFAYPDMNSAVGEEEVAWSSEG
jgi:hypothetical protein